MSQSIRDVLPHRNRGARSPNHRRRIAFSLYYSIVSSRHGPRNEIREARKRFGAFQTNPCPPISDVGSALRIETLNAAPNCDSHNPK